MSTLIIPSSLKKSKKKIFFFAFSISLLSLYPIYKNFYNGGAIRTYRRHIDLIQGHSEYYNPWQYRMLCPLAIEGLMWVYNHTIDKIYPLEEKIHLNLTEASQATPETKEFMHLVQKKGILKYMLVFILFRFFLNFLVFTLAFLLWRYFVKNNWLIFFGLLFISLAMGNGVIASDLTFNTYLDNVFYLLTACIIVFRKKPFWLIPLITLAAFNRETSMMIPLLYFVSQMDFSGFTIRKFNIAAIRFPAAGVWALTAGLYAIYFAIFIAVRIHYGYQPAPVWKVPPGWPMVKLNLFSLVGVKSYFEMLGVFSVIPLVILYKFRSFPLLLRVWFIAIVPAWFAVHIYSVVTYQTRLFLVPTIIIFLPMMLWLIESRYKAALQPDAIRQE